MAKKNIETLPLYDRLLDKIFAFYSTIWKDRRQDGIHDAWLNNFRSTDEENQNKERLNALYLLTKFMYFGNREMRELVKSVYRDLYKYPIISKIRQGNNDTLDIASLESNFQLELTKTRFLGVGNPSESGVHLLYYFRQENAIQKDLFINTHEIYNIFKVQDKDEFGAQRSYLKAELKDKNITRYIFIDDFCGSGTQAKEYSENIVSEIKSINPEIEVNYLMLFATEFGVSEIKKNTKFDRVEAIFTMDDTFKCFAANSRYYLNTPDEIDKNFAKAFCIRYGECFSPYSPLGYKDGQLLLSLFHNTPDNTLPIFWCENFNWKPIFKRYNKLY